MRRCLEPRFETEGKREIRIQGLGSIDLYETKKPYKYDVKAKDADHNRPSAIIRRGQMDSLPGIDKQDSTYIIASLCTIHEQLGRVEHLSSSPSLLHHGEGFLSSAND